MARRGGSGTNSCLSLWRGKPRSSGCSLVDVMQAVQHGTRADRTSNCAWPRVRRLHAQRTMRSLLVVLADEVAQHRRQVLLVQHDHVAQTRAAERPDDSSAMAFVFGARIGRSMTCTTPRVARVRFCRHGRDVRIRPGSSAGTAPKTPVASPALAPQAVVARSPPQPAGRSPDWSSPVRKPSFLAPANSRSSSLEPASPTGDTEGDPELEQLAPDPLGTPEPVVAGHGRDQLPHFGAEMGTTASGAGLPAPEQPPALPMPAHDCVGCHEHQVPTPASAEPSSQDPQQLVRGTKPSVWPSSSRAG